MASQSDLSSKLSAKVERNYLRLLLVLAAFVGVVLIIIGQWRSGIWADISTNIGIAFITAAILGIVLELYLRERLFSHIQTRIEATLESFGIEMADAIRLQRLPPLMLGAVKRQIVEPNLILRDTVTDYKFAPVTIDDGEFLRAEVTSFSTYENLASQSNPVEIFEVGCQLPPDLKTSSIVHDCGFINIKTETLDGTIDPPFNLNRQEIALWGGSTQQEQPFFRRHVTLAPQSRIKVTTTEVAYFELNDFDEWSFNRPAINPEIRVAFEGKKFNLGAEPDEALLDGWESSVDEDGRVGRWQINGALLPGQGIAFWWSPSEGEGESPESPLPTQETGERES